MRIVAWSAAVAAGLLGWCAIFSASPWLALVLAIAGLVALSGLASWIVDGHPWWSR